ncbi:MAG: ROK family protein [Methanomassiliicoccus sp.]|nr:ROK family protein [Methanomassiliicoccus sp.]
MRERFSIGIDIGRSNVRAARVEGGRPTEILRERTDVPGGPQGVLDQVREMIMRLDLGMQAPVGVGIAGQVDTGRGLVRCGPNLFWPDIPFQNMLAEAVGAPVVLRNDVVMATVGEWKHGAGRGVDDLVCLFVGTGIGGGAVVDGRLLEGATGCGGHFGHISVQLDGADCTCGRRGCVEAYAGGASVEKRVRRAVAEGTGGDMLPMMCAGYPEVIGCPMVATAAERGDPFALRVRDEMAAALSSSVASVINSLNPKKVVLGGTVLFGFPGLFDMVMQGAKTQCLRPAADGLTVEPSTLGDLAGVVGAATLALEIYG